MPTQNYKVYKGQGYLQLEFDCKNESVLTGTVKTAKIQYTKPDKITTGEWEAVLDGTKIKKQLNNDSIDQVGTWIFQPVLTIDNLLAPCEAVSITFSKQLN